MRVVCGRRDQDLLFLSLGMLSGIRQLMTGLHLRRCASCKERVGDFTESSRQLRLAFGGSPVPTVVPRRVSRLAFAALLGILLAAMGFGAYYILPETREIPPGSTREIGCAVPDVATIKGSKTDAPVPSVLTRKKAEKVRPKTKGQISGGSVAIPAPK